MIADWIDHELRNWARWCWSGAWPHPLPPSHCASIEHRYQAPSDIGAEVDAEEVARRIPIVWDRAEIVERVYRYRLTERERRVLVVRYVHRTPADQVARRTRLSEALVAESMRTSARLVWEAFRERRLAICA